MPYQEAVGRHQAGHYTATGGDFTGRKWGVVDLWCPGSESGIGVVAGLVPATSRRFGSPVNKM